METNLAELLRAIGSALERESNSRDNTMKEVLKEMKELKVLVHEWHVKDRDSLAEKLKEKTDAYTQAQAEIKNLQQQLELLQASMQTILEDHNTAYDRLKSSYQAVQDAQHQMELNQCQAEINRLTGEMAQQKADFEKQTSDREGKLQAEIDQMKEKLIQQETDFTNHMTERETELQAEIQELKNRLNEQQEQFQTQTAEEISALQEEKKAAESKRDALLNDLGSSYTDKFADLYRRFKESPWAQTDTAMRYFFAEDYATFFALCGNEEVVRKFHKNLQSVILREEKEYVDLADELLDFCVAACSAVNKASYSRQTAENGDSYSLNRHIQCGRRDGDKIYVILQGIQKGEQTFLGSFVKVGNGGEA